MAHTSSTPPAQTSVHAQGAAHGRKVLSAGAVVESNGQAQGSVAKGGRGSSRQVLLVDASPDKARTGHKPGKRQRNNFDEFADVHESAGCTRMVQSDQVLSTTCSVEWSKGIADQLYAAKAVLWRGSGDLPQRGSWPELGRGLWIVLDFWSGMGSLLIGLCSLGVRCICVSAESDKMAQSCIGHGFPNTVIISDVHSFDVRMLDKLFERRQIAAVLIGGGSPCQGNTSQNPKRKGLQDSRTLQAFIVPRVAKAVRERFHVNTVEFLENAGSSPPPVVAALSKEFGTNPIAVGAEQCGYVKRNRLFWGRNGERTLEGFATTKDCTMPPMWTLEPRPNDPVCKIELRYSGKKPIPSAVHLDSHFELPFNPHTLMKEGGDKALYPFVRCFPHPEDLINRATPEAVERFRQDKRRYPPAAYEAKNLLWRGEDWRQPTARERACIHEVPFDILKPCDEIQDADLREATRASLLGNGWHMGTFLVVLFMLIQLGESRPTS